MRSLSWLNGVCPLVRHLKHFLRSSCFCALVCHGVYMSAEQNIVLALTIAIMDLNV